MRGRRGGGGVRNPTSLTLNPKPHTPNPKIQTLNPNTSPKPNAQVRESADRDAKPGGFGQLSFHGGPTPPRRGFLTSSGILSHRMCLLNIILIEKVNSSTKVSTYCLLLPIRTTNGRCCGSWLSKTILLIHHLRGNCTWKRGASSQLSRNGGVPPPSLPLSSLEVSVCLFLSLNPPPGEARSKHADMRPERLRQIVYEKRIRSKPFWQCSLLHEFFNFTIK